MFKAYLNDPPLFTDRPAKSLLGEADNIGTLLDTWMDNPVATRNWLKPGDEIRIYEIVDDCHDCLLGVFKFAGSVRRAGEGIHFYAATGAYKAAAQRG
jgi:hypothetical protein